MVPRMKPTDLFGGVFPVALFFGIVGALTLVTVFLDLGLGGAIPADQAPWIAVSW